MGKATRWLKGLLGRKKDREKGKDSVDTSISSEKSDKKRWSFAKSGRNDGMISHNAVNDRGSIKDVAWLRSYLSETEKEQKKHAIAVAAATAAAADAAVAAAQAAVEVFRLTSHGRNSAFAGDKDWSAAIKIQNVFRGYLARKALRALKGLVKLQALVRGYLVRKRTTATLQRMQALLRAQTAVRSLRAHRSLNKENRHPENRPRKFIERFDDLRGDFHSKRLSTSYELTSCDDTPKIVEIDTYKPRSRSRRITAPLSEFGDDFPYQGISSPLPCPTPARICIPEYKNRKDFEWYVSNECRFPTAHSTPRFSTSASSLAPTTPAKSGSGDSLFRPNSNYPNYMANTQVFNAKLRSHSAPKQRPEPLQRKKLSLNEIMASRNSISSIRIHR